MRCKWPRLQSGPQKSQAPAVQAKGDVLHLLTSSPGIIDSVDPPLAYTIITWDIEYATCAKLFNYPDAFAPAGYRIRPEIAEALPTVSDSGKTYTFTIRPGFRFSPPSGQEVTARTFKFSIERALAPGTKSFAANFFSDIDFSFRAIRKRKASHLAGVLLEATRCVMKLAKSTVRLAARLAMPFVLSRFPLGTPVDFKGLAGIPSAGPYYVASYVPKPGISFCGATPTTAVNVRMWAAAIDIRPVPTQEQAMADVEHRSCGCGHRPE